MTGISSSDRMSPFIRYGGEGDYWFADVDPVYVQYVSDDVTCGLDLGKWPPVFAEYVALRLAFKACGRISSNSNLREELMKLDRKHKNDARSKDAMGKPPAFPPPGGWSSARMGANNLHHGRRYLRG